MIKCPHCQTPIDEHEATRCLDLWIAQDVMKWELWTQYLHSNLKNSSDPKIACQYLISPHAIQDAGIKESSAFWEKTTEIIPDINLILQPQKRFSTSIEAAWEVIEKWPAWTIYKRWNGSLWYLISLTDGEEWYEGPEALTAPLAICLAALKAATDD